jgi:hypothetical protein
MVTHTESEKATDFEFVQCRVATESRISAGPNVCKPAYLHARMSACLDFCHCSEEEKHNELRNGERVNRASVDMQLVMTSVLSWLQGNSKMPPPTANGKESQLL